MALRPVRSRLLVVFDLLWGVISILLVLIFVLLVLCVGVLADSLVSGY